jgi:hypothetical protein
VVVTRAEALLLILGSIGLIFCVTAIWGVAASSAPFVHRFRERYAASGGGSDRARLLAGAPFGSLAVVLGGFMLMVRDSTLATVFGIATIVFIVAMLVAAGHPRRFLPQWAKDVEDAADGGLR